MNKKNVLKLSFVFISILFVIPSAIYLITNKTVLNFTEEFCFFLTKNIDNLYQSIAYFVIIFLFILCYYLIIKNRKKIFENEKQIYSFVLIISLIFVFSLPFMSSDVFYYLGVGRLASKYHQNPYYIDIRTYIDANEINIQNDTVMQKGYNNYWAGTTVVYGAFWTIISTLVSFLSFGNINLGLLIFKLLNVLIHVGNCYLLYKISKKKIFPILYGLNPFILIEGIVNVHNDMFVIFFMLLSLYMLLKEKNLILSILFLALAADIKYFPILLLPFIIIYYYRDKDIKTRLLKCIQYGIIFVIIFIIPYLIYIKDWKVFLGLFEQRNRISKGIYVYISNFFNNPPNLIDIIKNMSFLIFTMFYIIDCIALLFKKRINMNKIMRLLFKYIIIFIFVLITNFQTWYFIWLVPFLIWQKSENIKLIIQMQIMTLIANIVFLIYSENFYYGIPFFMILFTGILSCIIYNKNKEIENIKKCIKI